MSDKLFNDLSKKKIQYPEILPGFSSDSLQANG